MIIFENVRWDVWCLGCRLTGTQICNISDKQAASLSLKSMYFSLPLAQWTLY